MARTIKGRGFCNADEIAVLKSNYTDCYPCPICRRGRGATHPCGTAVESFKVLNKPIGCEWCIKGQNYSPDRSIGVCKTCTICQENRKVDRKCTRRLDTVCGKCKNNFYEETDDMGYTSCEKCSKCCHDGKDKIEQHCVDQGLPSSDVCSRWPDAGRCRNKQNDLPASAKASTSTSSPKTTTASTTLPPETTTSTTLPPETTTSTTLPPATSTTLPPEIFSPVMSKFQQTTSSKLTGTNDIFIANTTSSTVPVEPESMLNIQNINQISLSGIVFPIIGAVILVIAIYYFIKWLRGKKCPKRPSDTQAYEAVELQPTQADHKESAEGKPTDQAERKDESTRITPYLDNPETHCTADGPFEKICDYVNGLKYDDFEKVCIRLGIGYLKVRQFYPHENTGKFKSVLRTLASENPNLTLEDIAQACEGHQFVVDLLRAEDKRLQKNKQIMDEETVEVIHGNSCN